MGWQTDAFVTFINFVSNNIELIETLFLSSVVVYIGNKTRKGFKLRKDYESKDVILYLPPEINKNFDSIRKDKLNSRFKDDILEFGRILETNFDRECLQNFYNNINYLNIYRKDEGFKDFFLNHQRNTGMYFSNNKIELSKRSSKSVLFHELLHLSSSNRRNGVTYIGFNQISNDYGDYGRGINEGYTEYLNRKYFSPKSMTANYYDYLSDISGILESIIGENLMHKFYFKSDLLSLYHELSKYVGELMSAEFIKHTDYVYKFFHKKDTFMQWDLINNSLKEINRILINAYINKLKNESLSEEEFNININQFLVNIPQTFYSGNKTYYINDEVDFNDMVNEIRSNNERSI